MLKDGAHFVDMSGRVVFCWVIPKVLFAAGPDDFDLFVIVGSVFQPMETHIYHLGSLLPHRTVYDPACCFVISLHDRWWLGKA